MRDIRFCPAKINLFLEVTGKLPNGYHELATLFAKINIGDWLTVEATPAEKTTISLTLTGPVSAQITADSNNLVWRAAQIFLDFFHLQAHVSITLDKHIPTGAGLGGGSSDAVGVLISLCKIFRKDVSLLLPTAAKLGADVPLFMYEDTFLKGEGIGEKLTPIFHKGPLPWLVLAYPNMPVPTKGVFARLQLPSRQDVLTNLSKLDKLINAVKDSAPFSAWKGLLFNRLEECVLPYTPSVKNTWCDLRRAHKDGVLMSGSGSTIFALAETEQAACKLARQLENTERTCFVTHFLEKPIRNENNRDPHTPNE
ncbi:MAG: 4-(cytidine 5'-diphospho)-2-C-methyl-D-erythritol kinase [Elusimicrobiaceae bacterium]|nr:4-(cytidine 5'-diphospho)-2-C-methyl-D-erythritol kinase [Elusimicrobiaceae bacterium]